MTNEEILQTEIYLNQRKMIIEKASKMERHNGVQYSMINETVVLSAMEAARKYEAERFAEWVMKNYYETDDDGMWYKWLMRSKSEDPAYTTSELYQIFKTQTNG